MARKDATPHERGLMPMPPSEFFCLPSPIPMLASAARRQLLATSMEFPPIPLTLEHLPHAI